MKTVGGLFDISGFPPRWHCGDWSLLLGWTTILSDLAIFTAYTAIPVTIALYVRAKRDVPFPHVFWLFCAFIFSCGATHLIEAIIFWYPIYPLQGVVKLFTALVSIAAVLATANIMPKALAIPGIASMNRQLQQEVATRTVVQAELQRRSEDLQNSEARLLAAQRAARIGDWDYDPVTQRIFWGEEIFRLFGRNPAQGPPQDFAENMSLYTAAGAETLNACMTRISAGENRVEGTFELLLPTGAIAWHRGIIHATRAADGTVQRMWGTAQDITPQKLDELAKDHQRQELEHINQQLEQFAYIASHDLLEPLRKMRFFTDVVTEEAQGRLTPEGEDAVRRLIAASDRMANLVRDLLAFARAGKSLVAVKPVALVEVLNEAIDNCDATIRETGATIVVEPLPEVPGDHLLLVQVFQNLISNALRYRHPDRSPQITVGATSVKGQVQVMVRDNGLGFDVEQAGRLFDPFVRLHPHVTSSGTGIGLAICKRIVAAHGGNIRAAPRAEGGAEFTVGLPLTKESSHDH